MVNEAFDGQRPSLDMLSSAERQVLDQAFSTRLTTGDYFGEEAKQSEKLVGELFEKYPPELIWDYYMSAYGEDGRANPFSVYPLWMLQRMQEERVDEGEAGENVGTTTFGLYEPAYVNLLEPYAKELSSSKKLNTLLLGSLSRHSANEFYDLSRRINSRADAIAMDIGADGIMDANRRLMKVQGDATEIPLKDESQDIVFTNSLLRYLSKSGLDKPDGGLIMDFLAEEKRVLKPGGFVAMVEHVPRVNHETFDHINFSNLLVHSFEHEGFEVVNHQPGDRYADHIAKVKRDRKKIESGMHSYRDSKGDTRYYYATALLARKPKIELQQ